MYHGLTEEYLLKFQYGRHDNSDIIDTLQEYWYDWGDFRDYLYIYQDVFPGTAPKPMVDPTTCNDCNISKHMWSFSFDSWSTIQLHLQKDRRWYRPRTEGKLRLTDLEWVENRLKLMLARDVLRGQFPWRNILNRLAAGSAIPGSRNLTDSSWGAYTERNRSAITTSEGILRNHTSPTGLICSGSTRL